MAPRSPPRRATDLARHPTRPVSSRDPDCTIRCAASAPVRPSSDTDDARDLQRPCCRSRVCGAAVGRRLPGRQRPCTGRLCRSFRRHRGIDTVVDSIAGMTVKTPSTVRAQMLEHEFGVGHVHAAQSSGKVVRQVVAGLHGDALREPARLLGHGRCGPSANGARCLRRRGSQPDSYAASTGRPTGRASCAT
jgi:hypothetical protein